MIPAAKPAAPPPLPAAPPAKPPTLQAVAKTSDVEPPPKIDIAEVEVPAHILALERANALPNLVDESTADTFTGMDEAPTAKPRVVDLSKLPTAKPLDDEDEEESAEEPTLLRPSPLEQQDAMESSISEEPTLLRASPLEQKDAPLSSSEEPTLLRRSPLESEEQEAQTTRPEAQETKPSEEATDRKLRIGLPPEVIAQAEAELAMSADDARKAAAVGPKKAPVRELRVEVEEPPPNLVRTPKPRSAALWGLALAAIASVAALIVVAIATDWPSRLRGPAQPTPTTVVTAGPDVPEPPVTALPTTTAVPATDAGPPAQDAGQDDAAVAPAVTAGADAGTDAGADAGTDAGAAPPTTATAPASAPPGDPMSLPEKKGYLLVTTPSPVHVYVQGSQAGKSNESLVVDCGPKFIRLGDPPAVPPPPGAGAGAVRWRSEGRSVVVPCRGTASVAMTPTP